MRPEKVDDIDLHYVGRMDGWRMRAMINVDVIIRGSVCQKVMGDVGCRGCNSKVSGF